MWLPHNLDTSFFLPFVDAEKKRISYAASIGVTSLTDQEQEDYRKNLLSFNAISVREKQAVSLLQDISPVEISYVLDPVFLLDASEWKKITSARIIKSKYLFCYFLGNDEELRKIAQQYAKEKKLKIVTLPYLQGVYHKADYKFGEYRLFDITANDFLSLIFNADFIMTDSFHVTAFSIIFEKEFIVYQRDNNKHISSRIADFTMEMGVESRYCNIKAKRNIDYIKQLKKLDFENVNEKIALRKKESEKFLFANLQ